MSKEKGICAYCRKNFVYEYKGKVKNFCKRQHYDSYKKLVTYHDNPEKAKEYHKKYKSTILGRQKIRELWKRREKTPKRLAWKKKYKAISRVNLWLLREKWKKNPEWMERQRGYDRKRRILKDRKHYKSKSVKEGWMGSTVNLRKDIAYLDEMIAKAKKELKRR